MTSKQVLAGVAEIVARGVTYREGGSGKDGTCDCVGLIMGAMDSAKPRKWPYHSSNWFARCNVTGLTAAMENTLSAGMVVFKTREAPINDRYQPGGVCYVPGLLMDFYHIGIVTSVGPLRITHCTGGSTNGIKVDSAIGGWSYAAKIKGVDYMSELDSILSNYNLKSATVTAQSGKTVNLRAAPITAARILDRVPIGATVEVMEEAAGWAHVVYGGTVGYMMSQFLEYEEAEAETEAALEADSHCNAPAAMDSVLESMDVITERLDALDACLQELYTMAEAILENQGGVG